jgi:hypothetical protein
LRELRKTISANEISKKADFKAGSFSPLAFLIHIKFGDFSAITVPIHPNPVRLILSENKRLTASMKKA